MSRKSWLPFAVAASITVFAAGCGDDSTDSASGSGESKPASLKVALIQDATGVLETFNTSLKKGWDMRIDEANSAKEIGGTKLSTEVHDSRADPKAGAGAITEVSRSDTMVAAYGTSGSVAPAIAPVAQSAKLPLVIMQAGAPGVVEVGEYIFRATAPQYSYTSVLSEYFKSQGVKRVAVVYNSDNGTLKEVAEKRYPEDAKHDGWEIVDTAGVSVTATDISSELTGVVKSDPDAVLMLVVGQQNASVVTRLRRAGFDGVIAAQPGVSTQALEGLGEDADGVIWPADFTAESTADTSQKFLAAFKEKYSSTPDAFASAGYDGASMIIEALKTADSYDRDAIKEALNGVASAGFAGAVGPITFKDRDARVAGLLVEWKDGKETLHKAP